MKSLTKNLVQLVVAVIISMFTLSDFAYAGGNGSPSGSSSPRTSSSISMAARKRPHSTSPSGPPPQRSRILGSASHGTPIHGPLEITPSRVAQPRDSVSERYPAHIFPRHRSWPRRQLPRLPSHQFSLPDDITRDRSFSSSYTSTTSLSSSYSDSEYPPVFSPPRSPLARPNRVTLQQQEALPPGVATPSATVPSGNQSPQPHISAPTGLPQQPPRPSQPHIPPSEVKPPYMYRPMR